MTTRIYSVITPTGARLVRAATPAQAVRHVASEFKVAVASQDALVTYLADGVKVETAGAETVEAAA